jgi:hypothetical protein
LGIEDSFSKISIKICVILQITSEFTLGNFGTNFSMGELFSSDELCRKLILGGGGAWFKKFRAFFADKFL